MVEDKTKIGLVFKSPRATDERQEKALRAAGATWIIRVGSKGMRTWREPVRQVMPGDAVFIYALVIVPTKRGDDKMPPSGQLGDFLLEVHGRQSHVVEVYTGRKSNILKQRREMLADAVNGLRSTGKPLPAIGDGPGRKADEWPSDEVRKAAQTIWRSPDYTTNEAAARHMPVGVTKALIKKLGPSGRSTAPKRKRRASRKS